MKFAHKKNLLPWGGSKTKARSQRKYDHEYKVQAVKLAREIGGAKAAKELGVPEGTIHTWLKVARSGGMDIGEGSHTPESAMSIAE